MRHGTAMALAIAPPADLPPSSWALQVSVDGRTRRLRLGEGRYTIGKSARCDLFLDLPGMRDRHATLELAAQSAYLELASDSESALVNGVRVRAASLHAGDVLVLSDARITLTRPGATAAAEAEPTLAERDRDEQLSRLDRDAGLELVDRLCSWSLRGPSSGRSELLADLCALTGAERGAVLLSSPERTTCLAACADALHDLDLDELLRGLDRAHGRTVVTRAPGLLLALVKSPGGPGLGVLLRGAEVATIPEPFLRVVTRLFAHEALKELAAAPASAPTAPAGLAFPPGIVIGVSPVMRELYRDLGGLVDSRLPVLVLGETGVGKEHVARVVHASSARREAPFVTINCAAIPSELLEAELFGIERGVATGVDERPGKFREAHRGTLFLDEIGELPLALQAKLLRALEEKEVRPIGGRAEPIDVRVVSATNAPLDVDAGARGFRLDLYHRLAGFVVRVPPLRSRPEDLPLLCEHFVRQEGVRWGGVTAEALAALIRHPWPGNVRELRHEAARMAARLGTAGVLDRAHLSTAIGGATVSPPVPADLGELDQAIHRVESSLIAAALREHGGNVTRAAGQLGISRTRLYRRMRELRLATA